MRCYYFRQLDLIFASQVWQMAENIYNDEEPEATGDLEENKA